MIINIKPLIHNKEFRYLFLGQTISFFGSMMTYVAIPYQIYNLTKSSFLVGLLGAVQLIPLIIAGLYGGALADTMERRKLLIGSELFLTIATSIMMINSLLPQPSVVLLFILAGLCSVFVGFHRPAMEALTPQIVPKSDLTAVSALGSLRYSIGAVAAPAVGGWLIASYGIHFSYGIDSLTYLVSLFYLWRMKKVAAPNAEQPAGWKSVKDGFRYAVTHPVILGTYIVDIIAMVFAMPMALYPALAEGWGGATAAGWLYSAIPMGALLISLMSGLLGRVSRQGAGVILSATIWGVFIVFFAFSPNLYWGVFLLAIAGACDAVSAIYRQTIWNEIIPTNYRGRLAGLNMLSYMIGPLLGNARAGLVASASNNFVSIFSGGILCVIGCGMMIWLLPKFWHYRTGSI